MGVGDDLPVCCMLQPRGYIETNKMKHTMKTIHKKYNLQKATIRLEV